MKLFRRTRPPVDWVNVEIEHTDGTHHNHENVEALGAFTTAACAVYRDRTGIVLWYPLYNIRRILVWPVGLNEA